LFCYQELLENTTIPSGVFQVSDDKSLSTNELIQLLGISLGKKNKILNIPSSWIKGLRDLRLFEFTTTQNVCKINRELCGKYKKLLNAIGKPCQ
jgi:hypothetical protein